LHFFDFINTSQFFSFYLNTFKATLETRLEFLQCNNEKAIIRLAHDCPLTLSCTRTTLY